MKTFREWVKKRIREVDASTDMLGKLQNIVKPSTTPLPAPNVNIIAAGLQRIQPLKKAMDDLTAMKTLNPNNKKPVQTIQPISPISPSAPGYGGSV